MSWWAFLRSAPAAASVRDGNLLRWAGGICGVKRTAAGATVLARGWLLGHSLAVLRHGTQQFRDIRLAGRRQRQTGRRFARFGGKLLEASGRRDLEEFCAGGAGGARSADHRERVRDAAGQQDEATRI